MSVETVRHEFLVTARHVPVGARVLDVGYGLGGFHACVPTANIPASIPTWQPTRRLPTCAAKLSVSISTGMRALTTPCAASRAGRARGIARSPQRGQPELPVARMAVSS
jgi:hypothetical protein